MKMEKFETFEKEMNNFKTRVEKKFNVDGSNDVDKAAINANEWMDLNFNVNNMKLEFNNIKSVFNEKTIMKINETSQTVI